MNAYTANTSISCRYITYPKWTAASAELDTAPSSEWEAKAEAGMEAEMEEEPEDKAIRSEGIGLGDE